MIIVKTYRGEIDVDGLPNICPYCHKSISPNALFGHVNRSKADVLFTCPNQDCSRSFIGFYDYVNGGQYYKFNGKSTIGNFIERKFPESITKISNYFPIIYNQSYLAEQQGLNEICGVGYRKALEFLIKDYSILNYPSDREKIEKKLLSSCISEFIDDARIKTVAKRATWLGNDETHYVRKWEGKNLEDLKKLIELTVHWIEMEALTKSIEIEMPD